MLRPSIDEALLHAIPGRPVHVWQMQDPNPPVPEEMNTWISLPMLMQEQVDKMYAKYQLDIYEAEKRLERGEIKASKVESIRQNRLRPIVLMHSTGQPANAKYLKDHLITDGSSIKLKDSDPKKIETETHPDQFFGNIFYLKKGLTTTSIPKDSTEPHTRKVLNH